MSASGKAFIARIAHPNRRVSAKVFARPNQPDLNTVFGAFKVDPDGVPDRAPRG